MEAWIISDFEELAERIRDSLLQLGIRGSSTRALGLAAGLQFPLPVVEGEIVFYAVPVMSDADINLLQRITSAIQATVVVVSSVSDHASVLQAIRAGAADFLDGDGDLTHEIGECLSRIASHTARHAPKAQIVSIVPCYVPSDANVLATNIAAIVARRLGSCCLLDFQLRGGDLALLLKLTPRHTIYDLINQCHSIDDAMFREALTRHDSGIHLLAGPELFSDLRGIQPQACEEILSRAEAAFPFVVVVTEDIQHSEQLYALTKSQHIIMAMRPDVVSLHRAKRHIEFMAAHQIENEHLRVVAIGTGLTGELELSAVKRVLRVPEVYCVPDDAEAITASINVGNPIVLESPRSKASRTIDGLVSTLAGWNDSEKTAGRPSPLSVAKAAVGLAVNTLPFCR